MALRIIEFFGHEPLDLAAIPFRDGRLCPFVNDACIKPRHGACSVAQISNHPVICCPNRLYAEDFKPLRDIAIDAFGPETVMIPADAVRARVAKNTLTGKEVVVFGRYWGHELPLPRPPETGAGESRKYYVDWVLAKLDAAGTVTSLIAVEVQTIDTTGNYSDQSEAFFRGHPFLDLQGRQPGFSSAGMNWENVNKRILPQLIYKGHVLRREKLCSRGLYFICPTQVYTRIRERLGGKLHAYRPGNGTITFRSYDLEPASTPGDIRPLRYSGQFTTTVDQVALAFTSPQNLPEQDVYEKAVNHALDRISGRNRQG